MIGTNGERESGKSLLIAQHDDDDNGVLEQEISLKVF